MFRRRERLPRVSWGLVGIIIWDKLVFEWIFFYRDSRDHIESRKLLIGEYLKCASILGHILPFHSG